MSSNIIYPYPTYRGGFSLSLEALSLDGEHPSRDLRVTDHRILNLHYANQIGLGDWVEAEFRVVATAEPEPLAELEKHTSNLRVVGVLSCGPTNCRQTISMKPTAGISGQWSGVCSLERDNYAGKATVRAIMVAAVDSVPHRFVGETEKWKVNLDTPVVPQLGSSLPVRWADFGDPEAPMLARMFRDAPYVVDLEEQRPTIYLNAGLDGLRELLEKPPTRAPAVQRTLHETMRMGLARSVWLAMFGASVTGILCQEDSNGEVEETDWPRSEWQTAVLKHLLPRLWPGKPEREALEELVAARRGDMNGVLSQVEALLGEQTGANKNMRSALHRMLTEDMQP